MEACTLKDLKSVQDKTLSASSVLNQIGNTPLVELVHLPGPDLRAAGVRVFAKLEGNNPAGSVKDRPALAMIEAAEARGDIRPGDTLIEATSGNTGIALAMVAAVKGYRMVLIMPENQTMERRQAMAAYGAELVLVSREQGMEGARDLALAMQADGKGRVLDQFANDDNWLAHYRGTGPEIWQQTGGAVTHFVSAMGYDRHHHRRVAPSEGDGRGRADHRCAAGGGLVHRRHPCLAGRL